MYSHLIKLGIKVQQRHVLTAMLFIATTIAFAERGVLPMAITRMVAIPQQNDVPTNEAICTAPKWAANATDGPVIFDEAVSWHSPKGIIILFSISL